jgi:hypothetical protein
MNLELTFSHFEEILKKGYNLDVVFLLKFVEEQGCDIKELSYENPKLSVLYQTLIRKGLISDECLLTLDGKALVDFLSSPIDSKIEKRKPVEDHFNNWWKVYPGTDTFSYKGKSFTGTRSIRVKKDDCKLKFNKILGEGEYTADELVKALEFEVMQKKENSLKTGVNKMTFMQNSLTYLNQRTFEPYIELIKEGQKVEEVRETFKGTDI